MDKLLIFSLSVCLLLASGCNKQTAVESDYSQLTDEQRLEKANAYRAKQPTYYQGSRYRQEMFDTLIAMAPRHGDFYRAKSITHTKIGDYHLAFPLLEKAAALDPETLYYYAWVLINNYHDFPRALKRLEEYDQLTPNQMDYAWGQNVHHLKGIAHKQMGNYEAAIREFTTCLEKEGLEQADVYTIVYRGITFLRMGAYDKAIADFDLALSDYQRCTMAHFYKGEALLKQGNRSAALESLEAARALLKQGIKKTDPYKDVFDEIQEVMIEDLIDQ